MAGSCGLALLLFMVGSKGLQNASAEGETRTISMHHLHTDESITITYKRNGRYDDAAIEKLDWFLRDWRKSESTHMDPHLIDLVWEVQREAGTNEPIQVVCGYRSPQTNAMLRHRSSGVARFSQHMLGHALDFYIPGIPLDQLRAIGLRLQRGGVGFYPTSGSPFVHMDTATIRMWPRMTREQLVHVFPDGRTVHIPIDGKPLAGYALALADIRSRGGSPSEKSLDAARTAGFNVGAVEAMNNRDAGNPFAKLFASAATNDAAKDDDDDDNDASSRSIVAAAPAKPAPAPANATASLALRGSQSAAQRVATNTKPAAAPMPTPAPAPVPVAANPAPAAPAMKVAAAQAKPAANAKLVHVALLSPTATLATAKAATPATAASTTTVTASASNDVIAARGYWQGPADASADASTATSVDDNATGALSHFAAPSGAERPGEIALGYAAAPVQSGPSGIAALRAAAAPTAQAAVSATTVAVKRTANQVASAIMTASATTLTVIKNSAQLNNPWLRAIVISPSVQRFLTTAAMGISDFRSLATQMVKPSRSVMMTFAAEPNPGLDHDRFSGPAIVFVSTVSYSLRTAALQ
jgi:uncharacterized protein YcbK (DUF882 family)